MTPPHCPPWSRRRISCRRFGETGRTPSAKSRACAASVTVSALKVGCRAVEPVKGTTATVPSRLRLRTRGARRPRRLAARGRSRSRLRAMSGARTSTAEIVPQPEQGPPVEAAGAAEARPEQLSVSARVHPDRQGQAGDRASVGLVQRGRDQPVGGTARRRAAAGAPEARGPRCACAAGAARPACRPGSTTGPAGPARSAAPGRPRPRPRSRPPGSAPARARSRRPSAAARPHRRPRAARARRRASTSRLGLTQPLYSTSVSSAFRTHGGWSRRWAPRRSRAPGPRGCRPSRTGSRPRPWPRSRSRPCAGRGSPPGSGTAARAQVLRLGDGPQDQGLHVAGPCPGRRSARCSG